MIQLAPNPFPMNPGPIVGAGNFDILANGLPMVNVRDELLDQFRPIEVTRITYKTVSGFEDEQTQVLKTCGLLVPAMSSAKVKPEGTRTWKKSDLLAVPTLQLNSEDLIVIRGVRYRVMDNSDFSEYGYIRYGLEEDYKRGRV